MNSKKIALYIGGFELPDKNAAAQRVIGVAKGLRKIGYKVIFLNSIKEDRSRTVEKKTYFGFECYEYGRESDSDYLFIAKTVKAFIRNLNPSVVLAYNYPGIALDRIRIYCKKKQIKCIADATEWYHPDDGGRVYRIIKSIDTSYRMKHVHKKMDGVIAISSYLFDYYCEYTKTVKIPPTVDKSDDKWSEIHRDDTGVVHFVYAGSPSSQKERLDLIVEAIERTRCDKEVVLNVIGITKKQFYTIYPAIECLSEHIVFWGRLDHKKTLDIIKKSDWSIIIRDNNLVVKAGFPTKLVESISCGTPVIINDFSNVTDYLNDDNSIMVNDLTKLDLSIADACNSVPKVKDNIFDYKNFIDPLQILLD